MNLPCKSYGYGITPYGPFWADIPNTLAHLLMPYITALPAVAEHAYSTTAAAAYRCRWDICILSWILYTGSHLTSLWEGTSLNATWTYLGLQAAHLLPACIPGITATCLLPVGYSGLQILPMGLRYYACLLHTSTWRATTRDSTVGLCCVSLMPVNALFCNLPAWDCLLLQWAGPACLGTA